MQQGLRHLCSCRQFPTLPALQSVSFEDVNFHASVARTEKRDEFPVGSQAGLADFIKRHASTLRELQIQGSVLTKGTIGQLAADPRLRLDRFVISSSEEDIYGTRVSEQRLLKWINRKYGLNDGIKGAPSMPGMEVLDRLDRMPQPCTHYSRCTQNTELTALNWSLR